MRLLTSLEEVSGINITSVEDLLPVGQNWMITKDIHKKIRKIVGRRTVLTKKQEDNIKGKIGEVFTKANLRKTFHQAGYRENTTGAKTFTLNYHYRGYIDFYLRFTNQNGEVYRCFIEVKNWKKWNYCTDKMFQRKILERFTKWDRDHKYYWILCINHRNLPVVAPYCEKYGILILPLREHYTKQLIRKIANENRILNDVPVVYPNI
jgi:hypothetical protein